MNQQKTVEALREIFRLFGPEILEDRGRLLSGLEDLMSKNAYAVEHRVLQLALDSDVLWPLGRAPAVTPEMAVRAANQLQQVNRMTAEDAEFVVRCVVIARGGDAAAVTRPKPEPTPVPPPVPSGQTQTNRRTQTSTQTPQQTQVSTQTTGQTQTSTQTQASGQNGPPARKVSRKWLAMAAVLAVLVCGLGLYGVLSGRTPPDSPEVTDPTSAPPEGADLTPEQTDIPPVPLPDPTLILPPPSPAPLRMGNTSGNIACSGCAAEYDGKVYYWDVQNKTLCLLDGNQSSTIAKGTFKYLNIADDWIYYCDSMPGSIFRIRTDGTDKELIAKGFYSCLTATEDWIYCIENFLPEDRRKIIRISIETGETQELADYNYSGYSGNFALDGDWLYYSYFEGGPSTIYKMRVDGSEQQEFAVCEGTAYNLQTAEGWLYWNTYTKKLYRIRTDGTGMESRHVDDLAREAEDRFGIPPDNYKVFDLNVSDGWVYTTLQGMTIVKSKHIWRSRWDGTELELLGEDCDDPSIAGNQLYCLAYDEDMSAYTRCIPLGDS